MAIQSNKVIFLDRDGVINHDSEEYIKSPDEWRPIPGSIEAIAKLTQAGFVLFITTNQSGISRGFFNLNTLEKIHQKMQSSIEAIGGKIEKIYFCPHHPDDNCQCRKPKPGLFENAAKDYSINLSEVYVIGDSLRDIQAGLAIKAKTILVLSGNGEKTAKTHKDQLTQTILAGNL